MAKNDSYNSGYKYAKALAHEVGAEPEHHAYGGKMGRMPVRAPRLAAPRVRAPSMGIPGGPSAGLPGVGAAPGPMPMPGGAPQMKHGGKAHKKYAKGGECKAEVREGVHKHERKDHPGTKLTKLAAGGVAKQRLGAADEKGAPTKPHIPSAKVKSRGKNAVKGG